MPKASRGPGRPPAAKAADTRERIVRAARQVFSELGYDAATFQEIAVRADLTRPAINHYFKSKKLLYREVVERTNEMVVLTSVQTAFEAPTLIGQLEGFINAAVGSDLEDRSAAAFLVTSVLESRRHPELRREDHDALLGTRQFLTWAVTGAIERGELSSEIPVPLLVEVMTVMFWGMGFYAGFVGSHQELEMITEHFKKLLVGNLWDWKS
ncbi:MAG TPA: TetR/AcrR family transcriptional regulator [Mycobacterium sp.]|nr:TetR/AcrR family transcriptional regulator [Mycobacterium sp.]